MWLVNFALALQTCTGKLHGSMSSIQHIRTESHGDAYTHYAKPAKKLLRRAAHPQNTCLPTLCDVPFRDMFSPHRSVMNAIHSVVFTNVEVLGRSGFTQSLYCYSRVVYVTLHMRVVPRYVYIYIYIYIHTYCSHTVTYDV